jgi:predicted pyridoxine 5'-phosphate oxidase superfamily flavin-nucleotide-binding protein
MESISTVEQLEQLIGLPLDRVRRKVRASLSDFDRQWLAASPFCVVSTADAQGRVDASPKGDPAGFIEVLDDTTGR